MLELLQTQDMLFDACVELVQQTELIDYLNTTRENARVFRVNKLSDSFRQKLSLYYCFSYFQLGMSHERVLLN